MRTTLSLSLAALALLLALSFAPWKALAAGTKPPKDDLYSAARQDLDAGRFAAAIDKFGRAAERGGKEADAALYWKAYAQNKAGRTAQALATLRQLGGTYPKSTWRDDAHALELEIRGATGQHPDPGAAEDEDLKLYALNGLLASDSQRAVPLVLKFLEGNHSPRLKGQALFVLSQSDSPEARRTLLEIARGARHPELQKQAIESLGAAGEKDVLAQLYGGTASAEVKLDVLDGYMAANARERIVAAARSEKDPRVRRKALELLGPAGAREELRQLYHSESDPGVRMTILDGLAVAGDVEALAGIARDEKDSSLRSKAVSNLGISQDPKATATLKSLYTGSMDEGVRRAALEGLFIQGNAAVLIELYHTEKDPQWRRDIVKQLGLMDSEEAQTFLSKIFGKGSD
ncbi:MAG TPA: HEAT repeat domain-containing protein [Thermoanaerobaculia bacterium]|jgi:HEAT repeat protein|nr:HEAT repeat domain-containing protein [Thermoanaerobaculia bacterium]